MDETVSKKEFLELKARVVYLESLLREIVELTGIPPSNNLSEYTDVHTHDPMSLSRTGK